MKRLRGHMGRSNDREKQQVILSIAVCVVMALLPAELAAEAVVANPKRTGEAPGSLREPRCLERVVGGSATAYKNLCPDGSLPDANCNCRSVAPASPGTQSPRSVVPLSGPCATRSPLFAAHDRGRRVFLAGGTVQTLLQAYFESARQSKVRIDYKGFQVVFVESGRRITIVGADVVTLGKTFVGMTYEQMWLRDKRVRGRRADSVADPTSVAATLAADMMCGTENDAGW